jgi:hypothetical protein
MSQGTEVVFPVSQGGCSKSRRGGAAGHRAAANEPCFGREASGITKCPISDLHRGARLRTPQRKIALHQGGSGMYEDDDYWPVKCPSCGHGFTESIRHIKSRRVSDCPRCSLKLAHRRKDFSFLLSEARGGRYNPWWEVLREWPPD